MITSSSVTNSSLSSFSEESETCLPEPPPPPPPPPPLPPAAPSTNIKSNECTGGKKIVHKIEPIFNDDKSKIRIFLEDGSLAEYSIGDLTTAEELVEEVSFRHSLGTDTRRYRLTLSETQDISWRSIRYIRPQQKIKEVSQWSCTTDTTVCTLRVVIVPYQAETLADTEPITFTYLYRQSINDYVRERAGSEISVDIAVQLTALLILDESLCTGVRSNTLVKRSWLLKQLIPRSLLDQFSLKQLIHRIRNHLQCNNDMNQLSVAKQFIRIFSENARSFAGKLFPDKHRDSILLVSARHPIAILDQARRIHSPVITLVSTWSHLTRVIVKQYRNGVAIRLLTTPRTTSMANNVNDASILQQEIAFLIHTNLLNDFMAFVEGYSQLESSNFPLSIEQASHKNKTSVSVLHKAKLLNPTNEYESESSHRSPFMQRMLTVRKNHRTYILPQEKQISPPESPSLFELTRQFFTRSPLKTTDMDEHETVSNVPNRTTLVTWRTLVDNQTSATPPPPPILYRTVINVKPPETLISMSDDDNQEEPDIVDLTTSQGYYGTLSFPIRPPSPFADGVVWSSASHESTIADDEKDGIVIWSPITKQLTVHYNTNNSNNNSVKFQSSASSSSTNNRWKGTLDRILKRTKSPKARTSSSTHQYDSVNEEDFIIPNNNDTGKHVHWIDHDGNDTVFHACRHFVEHLKIFIQHIMNDNNEEIYLRNCQRSLNELNSLIDCSELKQAFNYTVELANKNEKSLLLQQQTLIARLISRTVFSS